MSINDASRLSAPARRGRFAYKIMATAPLRACCVSQSQCDAQEMPTIGGHVYAQHARSATPNAFSDIALPLMYRCPHAASHTVTLKGSILASPATLRFVAVF